jgi:hypothetical protein
MQHLGDLLRLLRRFVNATAFERFAGVPGSVFTE